MGESTIYSVASTVGKRDFYHRAIIRTKEQSFHKTGFSAITYRHDLRSMGNRLKASGSLY